MMDIKQTYYDIGNAVRGICDNVYAWSRPKAVSDRPDSYMVVRLPYSIVNGETDDDGRFNDFTTTALVEVYVRDSVSARNPNGARIDVMSDKLKTLLSRFPIVTDGIVASGARVTLQSGDGDGFSVAVVQAQVRTR